MDRPINRPTFARTPITANAPALPGKVDLNTVPGNMRDIYDEFNQTLDYLNTRVNNAQSTAKTSQEGVQGAFDLAASNAEDAYRTNLDSIQQANQDAQLANRLRTRAVGGAPSSGFLDLTSRTDQRSQRDVAAAGSQLSNAYRTANLAAQQALAQIQGALNDVIAQIQQDATLSLREKNNAIQQAKINAANIARSRAGAGGGVDLLSGLEVIDDPQGNVMGVTTEVTAQPWRIVGTNIDGTPMLAPNTPMSSGAGAVNPARVTNQSTQLPQFGQYGQSRIR